MKASELIKELESAIATEGDMEVSAYACTGKDNCEFREDCMRPASLPVVREEHEMKWNEKSKSWMTIDRRVLYIEGVGQSKDEN